MAMKKIKNIALALIITLSSIFCSCTDDFENLNKDPASLPIVKPEDMLYTVETQILTAEHCWNTIYASKFRWMQYGAGIWNYSSVQFTYFTGNIGNNLYLEYNNIGSYVTNMGYIANKSGNAENYSNLKNVGRILLIAKAIQTSDMYGSLVYSQGWPAREGKVDDKSMKPEFETQEQLVAIWDKQLKECIESLKTNGNSSTQVSLKGRDRAYNGDMNKWIKAANAIRLRLASRLWKIKPATAKAIAAEVLASSNSANVFNSNDDSFILWFDNLYTNIQGGNWHSVRDMEIASNALMNYFKTSQDPRCRIYFVPNNLTPENIEKFNAQQTDEAKKIPTDYTLWEGSSANYENWTKDRRRKRYYLTEGSVSIDMRPANTPQARLWKGNDEGGNGGNWAPIMTYAEFCYLASEFILREGISSGKSAKEWYESGLRASIDQWNTLGKYCDILSYKAFTNEEIEAFLANDNIKWNENKALEQIYAQTYIEHYKNVDEAWAFWKRTGYPNLNSTIVKFEEWNYDGIKGIIPRRVKFSEPAKGIDNYENLVARLKKMQEDPKFGDLNNEWGRVWWDAE